MLTLRAFDWNFDCRHNRRCHLIHVLRANNSNLIHFFVFYVDCWPCITLRLLINYCLMSTPPFAWSICIIASKKYISVAAVSTAINFCHFTWQIVCIVRANSKMSIFTIPNCARLWFDSKYEILFGFCLNSW